MIIVTSDEESDSSSVAVATRQHESAAPSARDFAFDSDEEDEQRVVLSAEESFKRSLEDLVYGMQNFTDTYQFCDAWDNLQKIEKLFKKTKFKRQTFEEPIPSFYLIHMNRFLENLKKMVDEDDGKLKKLKKKDAKLFSRFKTKILKGKKDSYPLQNQCEKYAAEHDIWADDGEMDGDEDEPQIEDEDEDSEGEENLVAGDENFDDWEDEFFATDDEEPSSDNDGEESDDILNWDKTNMYDRRFWMKKEFLKKLMETLKPQDEEDSSEESEVIEEQTDASAPEVWSKYYRSSQDEIRQLVTKAPRKDEKTVRRKLVDEYEMTKDEAREVWTWLRKKLKPVGQQKIKEEVREAPWNPKRIRKTIDAVLNPKGSVDRAERKKFIKILKEVDVRCERPQWRILVKILIVDTLLDQYTVPRHLKAGAFNDVLTYVTALVELLTEYPKYRLHKFGLRQLELTPQEREKIMQRKKAEAGGTRIQASLVGVEDMLKEVEVIPEETVAGLDTEFFWLRGSLIAYCDRLSCDLIAALKKLDSKSDDYTNRLEDKIRVVELCEKCRVYAETVIEHKMATLQFRHFIVKLTYEDYDSQWDILGEEAKKDYLPFDLPTGGRTLQNVHKVFQNLKNFDAEAFGACDEDSLFEFNMYAKKIKEEATLFTVHHLARHHRYFLARDILKASGIAKDTEINQSEILTQIIYNRTIARLAIAAFAQEDYLTAMTTLQKLYVTGKIKELLAQGVKNELRWKSNKTKEDKAQMQQEEQRMVPEHTFINQDLLESVHYISSLFFCIREVLLSQGDDNHNQKNRSFRRQWEKRQKREFLAPPENDRECILEAGARMMKGEWKECIQYLEELKCWEHFEFYAQRVKDQVFKRARAECLRCYLISSSKHFYSIKLEALAEKFEMDVSKIIQLCSQFIAAKDFRGSIDIPGGFLVVHEHLPTQFETSANTFHRQLDLFLGSIKEVAEYSLNIRQQNHSRERYRQNTRPEGRSGKNNWR